MESNYQQGDLTDIIIRAQGGNTAAEAASPAVPTAEWQFPSNIPVVDYSTEPALDYFGDPFTHFGDPLIHDIETPVSVSGFFHNRSSFEEPGSTVGFASTGGNININIGQEVINNLDDEMKRPNSFSGMLQISPVNAKLPVTRCESPAPASVGSNGPPVLISNDQGLQISSPRNTGIRRRKSQAKKVVCIPAPAPVNSRPSGEIVPSDLWAWRKYGQKPIKGSPYPRGYYRCSSSKGCSARKQVERSRTDPNMLVITYTSEHNHPWPTQRNALAGSTRSQPSKGNCKSPSNNSQAPQKSHNSKEEGKEISPEEDTVPVKEENMDPLESDIQLETEGGPDFDQGFPDSYKPILPDSNNQSEDNFFADLEEIETDSSLDIFGFSGDDGRDVRVLNPFNFYDWAVNSQAGGGASPGGATSNMEL